MNPYVAKMIIDKVKEAGQEAKYAQEYNKVASNYEDAVKKAYGLEDAYDFLNQGSAGRLADIITSRVLGTVSPTVAEGRSDLNTYQPDLVNLMRLRRGGTSDAFQGAREAEIQLPNSNDPAAMLNWLRRNKPTQMAQPQETQTETNDVQSILSKYGY